MKGVNKRDESDWPSYTVGSLPSKQSGKRLDIEIEEEIQAIYDSFDNEDIEEDYDNNKND